MRKPIDVLTCNGSSFLGVDTLARSSSSRDRGGEEEEEDESEQKVFLGRHPLIVRFPYSGLFLKLSYFLL